MDSQPELEQNRHEFFSRFKEGRRIRRHRGDGGEGFIRSHIFRVQKQKGEISSRLCSLPTKGGHQEPRLGLNRWRNQFNPIVAACFFRSLDHPVRPRQHVRRNRHANLLCRSEIDDKGDPIDPLHRQVGGLTTSENAVDVLR